MSSESYHFIIFRGQLEDTPQLAIHKIIRLCFFPLVEKRTHKKNKYKKSPNSIVLRVSN